MKTTRIRILRLINNFYRDDAEGENKNGNPLGPYCVLGYFDALESVLIDNMSIWNELSRWSFEHLDGNTHSRMIACMTDDGDGDDRFWDDDNVPFYFITLVRKLEPNKMTKEVMEECRLKINENSQIAYYSFEHSEIIVVTKASKYAVGIQEVENLREKLLALKSFTVFAIKESFLQNLVEGVKTGELVDCRLRCVIKDFESAKFFCAELEKICAKDSSVKFRCCYTLGGHDWVIEINGIEINYILGLYKEMNMMTHSNDWYSRAFYNVETEIFEHKMEIVNE